MRKQNLLRYVPLALSFFCIGCPPPDRNKRPDTILERRFDNNGTVRYIVNGTDRDGRVSSIRLKYNEQNWESFNINSPQPPFFLEYIKPIEERMNIIEAIAKDNKGAEDSSPAKDRFIVANSNEAYSIIEKVLNLSKERFVEYTSDPDEKTELIIGDKKILIDFNVKISDSGEGYFSIINYVDINNNLEEEIENEKLISEQKNMRSFYLYRLPGEEVLNRTFNYVENGFNKEPRKFY